MSTLLSILPHRRRSRRRARNLRARMLVGGVVLLLSAYIAWQPLPSSVKTDPALQQTTRAALVGSSGPVAEPDQSIDTEGALAEPTQITDAASYVAGR
jgi:hypothetical protein